MWANKVLDFCSSVKEDTTLTGPEVAERVIMLLAEIDEEYIDDLISHAECV